MIGSVTFNIFIADDCKRKRDLDFGLTLKSHGIIMVSQAHNMCKSGLDHIDCKSVFSILVA